MNTYANITSTNNFLADQFEFLLVLIVQFVECFKDFLGWMYTQTFVYIF